MTETTWNGQNQPQKIKIIADSTCDLTPEMLRQWDVDILPLQILLGETAYGDDRSVTPDEIYTWADAHKTTPKTAAPTVATAVKLFKPYLEAGRDIVCLSISQSMSGSGNVMRLAAEELDAADRVTVIDSASLSTGVGLLVIEAAAKAQTGASAKEIEAHVLSLREKVRASFVVDTLTYLHRGGRCSGLAAMAGGVLKLHPLIAVSGGRMAPGKKYRGSMSRVIPAYVQEMEDELKKARPERVFITHSGCEEEVIQGVKNYLEGLNHFREILMTRAGSVISSHCGPGTLGVLFIAGE